MTGKAVEARATNMIEWDFPGLPEFPAEWEIRKAEEIMRLAPVTAEQAAMAREVMARLRAKSAIAEDLRRLEIPEAVSNEEPIPDAFASREEAVAFLQRLAGRLIKHEIVNDPDELFRGVCSSAEVARLFNHELSWDDGTSHPVARVFRGLPYGPNAITATDVDAALGKG